MRRLLPLALLLVGCVSPRTHTGEWNYAYQVSPSDIALGLLSAPDAGSSGCRIDGELVDAKEAARRIRELPSGETVCLAFENGDASIELVVSGDGAIAAAGRGSWTGEVRSRRRLW